MKRSRTSRPSLLIPALLGLLALAGCSTLQSYPHEVAGPQGAFAAGNYAAATQAMERIKLPASDQLLRDLELGMFYQTQGDYARSTERLLSAVATMKEFDERAAISARDAASYGAALLLNDKARPYRGASFERVITHTLLAINFLMQHNLEGARVEILQGYRQQRKEREEHQKAIDATKREAAGRRLDTSEITARVNNAYGDQRAILEKAGNIYQNAFNYYLSSLVYEMNGEISDAYIDAKAVHSLNPNFLPTRRDLLRYSRQMALSSDYEKWRQAFGNDLPDAVPAGHGDIVVLFACGLAPEKEEIKLVLPVPVKNRFTLVTIAVPKYRVRQNPVDHANLLVDGATAASTQALTDVEATAISDLWSQAPGIAIRTLIRAASRVVMAEGARKEGGPLAELLVLLFGMVVEQADLRSWISLPRDFQACRVSVPAGTHHVELHLMGGGASCARLDLGQVAVNEGGLTVVRLRSTGAHGSATAAVFP